MRTVGRWRTDPAALLLHLVEQEGGGVGREDGGVDDQQQDEPVPHGLEGTVVQHGPFVDPGGLQLILWQHVCPQRQHLQTHTTRSGDQETGGQPEGCVFSNGSITHDYTVPGKNG